jgi:prepilin-type processing-associated H-X9-DG protein
VPFVHGSYATNRGRTENIAVNLANTAPPDPTAPYAQNCNSDPGDGMFGTQFSVKIGDITDGTSNTFLFGEATRYVGQPTSIQQIVNIAWEFIDDFDPTQGNSPNPFGPYLVSHPTSGAFLVPKLNAPPDKTGQTANTCFATVFYPSDWINVPACLNYGQYGFHSLHPGGANFAFADGSVKFIKDSIGVQVYRSLGTRALGEVISADTY